MARKNTNLVPVRKAPLFSRDRWFGLWKSAWGYPTYYPESGPMVDLAFTVRAIMEEAEGTRWKQDGEEQVNTAVSRHAYGSYASDPFYYAAVFAIMAAGAAVPLKWYRPKELGSDEMVEVQHPILNLLVAGPNPYMSLYDLMEETFAYLELSGEMYWEVEKRADGTGLSVYPARPDILYPKGNERDLITHYEFTDPQGGSKKRIDAERIVRFRYFHPTSHRIGMSSGEPARGAIDELLQISRSNRAYFERGAVPLGNLHTEQKLGPKDVDTILQRWNAAHQGSAKTNKISLTHSGVKYQEIGKDPKESGFLEGKDSSREDVLAASGVPPVLLGWLKYASYNTSESQLRVFYQATMLPKLRKVEEAINFGLTPTLRELTGIPGLVAKYDMGAIEALRESRKDRSTRVRGEYKDGLITRDEAREQIGQEPAAEGDGGDEYFSQFGGLMGTSKTEPAASDEQRVYRAPLFERMNQETDEEVVDRKKAIVRTTRQARFAAALSALRTYYRDQEERVLEAIADADELVLQKAFDPDVIRVMKGVAVDDQGSPLAMTDVQMSFMAKAEISLTELVNSLSEAENRELAQIMGAIGLETMDVGGEVGIRGVLGQPVGDFAITEAAQVDWLQHSMEAMTGANDTVRKRLVKTIAEGLAEGETSASIARRVSDVYDGITLNHSAMIAKTETQGAYNAGAEMGYKFVGVERKEWATSFSNSRATHIDADGQIVKVGEPFIVGGEELMFPGDPSGSFGNTHNCGCLMLPVVEQGA